MTQEREAASLINKEIVFNKDEIRTSAPKIFTIYWHTNTGEFMHYF